MAMEFDNLGEEKKKEKKTFPAVGLELSGGNGPSVHPVSGFMTQSLEDVHCWESACVKCW